MAQRGSEARDLRAWDAHPAPASRPALEVIEGEGLDARERQSLDPSSRFAFKLFLMVVGIVGVLAILRVQLTVQCVDSLMVNSQIRAEVSEAKDRVQSLAVEKSTLESAERIERIATQNLDMVYVGSGEPLGAAREG